MGLSGDRYRNCFYYFRGHASGLSEAERADLRERQFEDNTTKALVNVLEHGELLGSFMTEVAGRPDLAGSDGAQFLLQAGPTGTEPAEMLIGISALAEIDPRSWQQKDQPRQGRVDASFLLPSGGSVLVETKVVDYLDGPQLNRHAADFGVEELSAPDGSIPTSWKLVSWAQIFRWADRQSKTKPAGSVGHFLADQFREYLELTGLAPFSGFRTEHFAYFELTEKQRREGERAEVAEQIKARLDGIWGVIKELAPGTYGRLGEIRVGRLKAKYDAAFAETHSGEDRPNLTVELGAKDLQLNLVGWTGAQVPRVERWLCSDRGADALAGLSAFDLIFYRRAAKRDMNGKPFWMGAPGKPIDQVPAPDAALDLPRLVAAWNSSLDPTWERPAYHLRRSWLPTEVAGVGAAFIPDLIANIELLLPLLDDINQ